MRWPDRMHHTLPYLTALLLCLVSVAFSTSCEETEIAPPLAVCTPVLDSLEPDSGPLAGGTQVALAGLFISTEQGLRDTRIQVGGAEATVTGVTRGSGCVACDQCILAALRCAECDRVCRGVTGWNDVDTGVWLIPEECTEQVDFTTPAGSEPGAAPIIVTTARGSGVGLDFTYLGDDDDDSAGDDDDSAGDDDDSAGDDDDSAGDDDDSAGDDDDSAGDDDDSAGDDDDSAGDDDDSAL